MSFLRPEVRQWFSRWSEVLAGLGAALAGLWITRLGGLSMLVIGGLVTAAALALTLVAWRRMRFHVEVDAPGMVEIDEARITYMGPLMGGSVALEELVEIDVLTVAGRRRCWRLMQEDGQALLVPLGAAGADRLYDHFAGLPGADAGRLLSALSGDAPVARTVWRRPGWKNRARLA